MESDNDFYINPPHAMATFQPIKIDRFRLTLARPFVLCKFRLTKTPPFTG